MKIDKKATSVSILISLVGAVAAVPPLSEDEIESLWVRFKSQFSKAYTSEARRFAAFRANIAKVQALNEEQGVACSDLFDGEECVFGITKFSDLFEDEFAKTRLGYKRHHEPINATVLNLTDRLVDAPTSVDWRQKGAVSSVKDQGDCGSCWAFSATEEIESQVFMTTGKMPTLSTQQIISCDKKDDGCDGGDTVTAYAYVKKAGGIDTAADYPDKSHTTGRTSKCRWNKKKVAKVTGFTYATKPCNKGACKQQDEKALAAALVSKGPVSVCVNAGGSGWDHYKRGVYSKKCSGASSKLDHCVQLVGYNKSGPTPYWIIRNSWNTDWGINGYMYLKMGSNMCGVADEATIVEVAPGESDTLIV